MPTFLGMDQAEMTARLPLSLVAAAENIHRRLDVCYDRDSRGAQFKVWDDSGTASRVVGTFDTAEELADWLCLALDEAGLKVQGGCLPIGRFAHAAGRLRRMVPTKRGNRHRLQP